MSRKAHMLKPIKGTELKNNWVFFDTETRAYKKEDNTDYHKYYLGVAQYFRLDKKRDCIDEFVSYDPDSLCDWIVSKSRANTILMVCAHNMSFDFTACAFGEYLKDNGWTLKQLMIESKVVIIKYRKNKQSILFIDLFNYIKTSVAKMGELLGFPKLDIDFDNCTDEELTIYCRRDVEIIAKVMIQYISFVKSNDLGCLGMTTPSQAFNAYRHRFMTHGIFIHDNEESSKLERSSYFGGRTECYRLGHIKDKIYYIDVNSMYPYVMSEKYYPVKLYRYYKTGCTVNKLKEHLKTYCIVARCLIETNEPAYPYIHNKKTVFPIGKFEVSLCSEALRYAILKGHIKEVYEFSLFRKEQIFTAYIDYFYNTRLQFKADGNDPYQTLAKLMMNSLYGKFGQRVRDITKETTIDDKQTQIVQVFDEDGTKLYDRLIFIGDVFHIQTKQQESFNAFVAIASHVTDYARHYLYQLQLIAGRDNVYYCDTDSLMTNEEGYTKLDSFLDDKELGMLKLEEVFNGIIIKGLKDYETPTKKRIKGVKKDAKQLSENKYQQLQFPTLKGLIRSGITDQIPIKTIQKELKRQYDKGIVLPTGQVKPFKIT